MRLSLVTLATVAVLAAACSEAKDPLSDSHDVVTRAASQDLSVTRMARLMGEARIHVDLTPQSGMAVANLWSTYHRLAYAAAHNDTLDANTAITPTINSERVNRLLEVLRRPMHSDTATQAAYDSAAHGLYAVRHILFAFPPSASPAAKDSVQKLAAAVRKTLTAASFAETARRYSADKQSAAQGGYLGVIPRGAMNPSVVAIIVRLKPDSISGLMQSPLGVDIVQRVSWADARQQYIPAFSLTNRMANDSTTSDRMSRAANLTVTDAGVSASREAMVDMVRSSRDTTAVLATFDKGGRFTVADLIAWLNIMSPAQRMQVIRGMPQVPDSLASAFIRNLASRAILVRAADSAKIDVPETQKADLRDQFRKGVVQAWKELGVAPEQLADSAKSAPERESLASRRIDRIIDRGMAGEMQLAPIPAPIETALNAKYPSVSSPVALQKALDAAADVQRISDSSRAMQPILPTGPGGVRPGGARKQTAP